MDERAAKGFVEAENYNTFRPSYPSEAVAFIRRKAGLGDGSVVVDLAAGSGLMTRALRPVARLIAVEPLAEMRAVMAAEVPDAEVLAGVAEAVPLPSAIADAVVVAQAFHWFATRAAVTEIARILKPEGTLALVWNRRHPEDPRMVRLEAVLAPYRLKSPGYDTTPWRDVFEEPDAPLTISACRRFLDKESITLGHLKGRIMTLSYVALLDPERQAGVMRGLEEFAGSPADDTPILMRHYTEVVIARHRPER